MNTIVIQIDNNDNKLNNQQWSSFIYRISVIINEHCEEIHFTGGSNYNAPWQNACFVAAINDNQKTSLYNSLKITKEEFYQDSITVTMGRTEFI